MTGVVLAGAAALGAYEVGVLDYLVTGVARDVRVAMPGVVSGTSAGALNAIGLAAFADDPAAGTRLLVDSWSELRLGRVLRPSSVELFSMLLDVVGAPLRLRRALHARSIRGGLLDPTPIVRLVTRIPFTRIADHLASGILRGVAVSATRVATGAAVVFHQEQVARSWQSTANLVPVATRISAEHVLASAAIPLMFPAVAIDGEKYCDGGLRQMVPLSPAVHLGATRLLVVNPIPAVRAPSVEPELASPLYLAGKALNALFADRVEVDLARMSQMNEILRAGERRFGPTFEREINLELGLASGAELRPVDTRCIEPSQDLGALAADYVTGPEFAVPGAAGRLLRCIADGDPARVGDLLAFLLFDGGYTRKLIELGRSDARAHHEHLCALFDGPSARALPQRA